MYQLRPYQQKAVEAAKNFFRSPRKFNAIEVLPTGAGKSLVIAELAKELGEVLIFQPTKEILEQNFRKISEFGFSPSVYSASAGQKNVGNITLATIGSAANNPAIFSHYKNIIVDECHLVNSKGGMYRDFIEGLNGAKVLGLTATPYRLSNSMGGSILKFLTRTRPRVFDEMIYCCQCRDMAAEGYWSPLKYYQVRGFEQSRLRKNSTGADYDDASVQQYYKEIGFADRLLDVSKRLMKVNRKGILVFTRFVAESEFVVENVPGAVLVTGATPKKERDAVISAFRKGDIPMVCNVGVLTTGFDYPELDTVLMARPTMSLSLYYQMAGRCVRPHKDKKDAWVVDICDNFDRFGRVEDLHVETEGNGKWFVKSGHRQLTNVYF